MVIPGKIIEIHERVFMIEKCIYNAKGVLDCIHARCLTPKEGDESEYFSLEIYDEMQVVTYTLQ